MKTFTESDMYEPIKNFFLALDYEVRGEVLGCDIVLSKNGELIIVEMKKAMNLSLIYQAMDRQKTTNQVYIAVPRLKNSQSREAKNMLALAKKLELGLISVAMDSPFKTVELLNFPPLAAKTKNIKKRSRIAEEAGSRSLDLNAGGSRGRKLLTAFRERSVKIACILEKYGEMNSPRLIKEFGCESSTYSTLRGNYYGWFEQRGRGFFALSSAGKNALDSGEFAEIIELYRKKLESDNSGG